MPTTAPKRWVLLSIMMLAGALVSIQQTLVVPLLPHFSTILGATNEDVSWLVTITLLTSCVCVPVSTRMADMYGKRLMLLVSIALMIAGSVIAMSAPLLPILITGRAIQGASMGIIPIGISVLRENLEGTHVASAIALMSATMGIGGGLALPLAGVLFQTFGWQSTFLVVALVGGLLFILTWILLPESRSRSGGKFDLVGALLLAVALGALLLIISKGSTFGWAAPSTMALSAVALIAGVVWVITQQRIANPLVNFDALRNRAVLFTNAYSLLVGFAMMANSLLVTYQFQLPRTTGYGHGLDTLTATLFMLPGGLAMAALSPVSGSLINRFGSRRVLMLGAAVIAVGYTSLFLWHSSPLTLLVGSCIISSGIAFAYAAQPTMIMANVPESIIAASNGINSLVRSIGTSLASAVTAGLLATFLLSGSAYPSWTGFGIAYFIAICAGALAIVAATLIPQSPKNPLSR